MVCRQILTAAIPIESDARGLMNREQMTKSSSSSQEAAIVTNQEMVRLRSNWQLQDAKARFSELVKRAREQGPQHVSVLGEPAVVVVSEEDFARLTSSRPSIVDHILDRASWPDDLVDAINTRPG
jgi:prevent-host-death family protein